MSSAISRAAASSSPTRRDWSTASPAQFAEIKLKYLGRQKTLLEILENDSRADLRFGMDAAGEIYVLTKRDGMIRRMSVAEQYGLPAALAEADAAALATHDMDCRAAPRGA